VANAKDDWNFSHFMVLGLVAVLRTGAECAKWQGPYFHQYLVFSQAPTTR
jgi:hypothetical protein